MKKPHLLWLCQLLDGNPYLGYSHVKIGIYIIKLLLKSSWKRVFLLKSQHVTADKPWVTYTGLVHFSRNTSSTSYIYI